jgi:hypothetical protein
MNRTSTVRIAAVALALVSSVASNSAAQHRTNSIRARGHDHPQQVDDRARFERGRSRFQATIASRTEHLLHRVWRWREHAERPVPQRLQGWVECDGSARLATRERPVRHAGRYRLQQMGWRNRGRSEVGERRGMGRHAGCDRRYAVRDNKTSSFYLLGGGGVHYFPKYGSASNSTTTPGDTTTTTPPPGGYPQVNYTTATTADRSSTTRFGLNGGAGLSFGLPQGSALFLETRYVTVFTKDQRTNYWPLVGGIRWTMR